MERIDEKLRLLKPVLPEKKLNFLRQSYFYESDLRKRKETEALIDMLISKKVKPECDEKILLPPPNDEELTGEFPIGKVFYPDKPGPLFGIRKDEWIKHVGVFGQTGSGKTTLSMHILKRLCRKGIPFMVFDYKRNYRDLLNHPDFKDEDILIFTCGRNDIAPFFFNPKISPPGVEPHVWQKQLAQIIEKVYLLGPGALDVFMESAHLDTFREMAEKVNRQVKRARELLWWASVKRTLNSINFPGLAEMVNAKESFDIAELLKKKVIIELDGLSDYDKAFIVGSLLLWIYHHRMREQERETLKHIIVVEEAHHLFLKGRKEEEITDMLMREIRELGEGIVIIDQHPHKIALSCLGNLFTRISLPLSLNQDVTALANGMLLDRNQRKYLAMVTLGEAIVKTDRFTLPILLNIAPFPIQKGVVRDEDIKKHMEVYSGYSTTDRGLPAERSSIQSVSKGENLSPLSRVMLENLQAAPFIGLARRLKGLGLKLSEGYKLLEELELKGLIVPVFVDGKKLFDITQEGRRRLEELGKPVFHKTRGGIEHRYWIEELASYHEKTCRKVETEKDGLDLVAATKEGETIAIQLETGKSDLAGNIEKLSQYPAQHKYILATNRETEAKLRALIDKNTNPQWGIHVLFVKDYLTK